MKIRWIILSVLVITTMLVTLGLFFIFNFTTESERIYEANKNIAVESIPAEKVCSAVSNDEIKSRPLPSFEYNDVIGSIKLEKDGAEIPILYGNPKDDLEKSL